MKMDIELSNAQAERLREEAQRLNVTPEELVQAAVSDLLTGPDDTFKNGADRILRKNAELYRRLA